MATVISKYPSKAKDTIDTSENLSIASAIKTKQIQTQSSTQKSIALVAATFAQSTGNNSKFDYISNNPSKQLTTTAQNKDPNIQAKQSGQRQSSAVNVSATQIYKSVYN